MTSPPSSLHSCTCKHVCAYAFTCSFLSRIREDVTPPWQGRSRWESSVWGAWNLDFLPWEAPSHKAVLGHYIIGWCWDSCHLFALWSVAYTFHRVLVGHWEKVGAWCWKIPTEDLEHLFLSFLWWCSLNCFQRKRKTKALFDSLLCVQRSSVYETCIGHPSLLAFHWSQVAYACQLQHCSWMRHSLQSQRGTWKTVMNTFIWIDCSSYPFLPVNTDPVFTQPFCFAVWNNPVVLTLKRKIWASLYLLCFCWRYSSVYWPLPWMMKTASVILGEVNGFYGKTWLGHLLTTFAFYRYYITSVMWYDQLWSIWGNIFYFVTFFLYVSSTSQKCIPFFACHHWKH